MNFVSVLAATLPDHEGGAVPHDGMHGRQELHSQALPLIQADHLPLEELHQARLSGVYCVLLGDICLLGRTFSAC